MFDPGESLGDGVDVRVWGGGAGAVTDRLPTVPRLKIGFSAPATLGTARPS